MKDTHSPSTRLRSGRMRSHTACIYCHHRKIRCDAARTGMPCTNCSFNQVTCRLFNGRRSRPGNIKGSSPQSHIRPELPLLPQFIRPSSEFLSASDFCYLRVKDATVLPVMSVCNTLIGAYLRYFHPFSPFLAEDQIPQTELSGEKSTEMSLLLMNCILAIGQLQLERHEPNASGASSAQSLFDKAQLLYTVGWESDSLVLLQATLLMSFFPQDPGNIRGPAHWLHTAVSLAYKLGLHIDPQITATWKQHSGFRRRLWWCLYFRERTLLLDTGSPWIIRQGDYNVLMLSEQDFQPRPLQGHERDQWSSHNLAVRSSVQREMDQIVIQKAKLAVILGKLAPIRLLDLGKVDHGLRHHLACSQTSIPSLSELDKVDADLLAWKGHLLSESTRIKSHGEAARLLVLHRTMLWSLYIVSHCQSAVLRRLQRRHLSDHFEDNSQTTNLNSVTLATAHCFIEMIENILSRRLLGHIRLDGLSLIRPMFLLAQTGIIDFCESFEHFARFGISPSDIANADCCFPLIHAHILDHD